MIRVGFEMVEFWLKASPDTIHHNLPYGIIVNGVDDWRTMDFNAAGYWQLMGRWSVTYDQTVQFRLGDTNTPGLGGPTYFNIAVQRSSIPAPPGRVYLSAGTGTSMVATFSDGDNGGAPIDARQIWYSRTTEYHEKEIASDRSTLITGLQPGTVYYFWARTHNKNGWSLAGPRGNATTLDFPDAPNPVAVTNVTHTSAHTVFTFAGKSNGGTSVLEYQLGYGTSPTAPQQYVTSIGGIHDLTTLSPGATYYFWARARNSVGWGPLSAVRTARTFAGAWVKVGTVWRQAVPYVRVNGVWKPAGAWAKIAGYWKECG